MIRFVLMIFLTLIMPPLAFSQIGPPARPPEENTVRSAFSSQLKTPYFKPAIEYDKIERIAGCRDEVTRGMRYQNCRNSFAIYEAGLKAAKLQGRPLMIMFGFNRCPSCHFLHKQIFNPERPIVDANVVRYFSRTAIENYRRDGVPLEQPFIFIHARSSHGLKLADEIGATKIAKARGWHRVWSPFIVFVDPETETLVSQNYWEPPEANCDFLADFAVNYEELGFIETGEPQVPRKRCKRGA